MSAAFDRAIADEMATIKVINFGGKNAFCYNNGTHAYTFPALHDALFKGILEVSDDNQISRLWLNPQGKNSWGSDWEIYDSNTQLIQSTGTEGELLSADNFTPGAVIVIETKNVTHSPNFKRDRTVPETIIENCASYSGGMVFHSVLQNPNGGVNLADARRFDLHSFDRAYALQM